MIFSVRKQLSTVALLLSFLILCNKVYAIPVAPKNGNTMWQELKSIVWTTDTSIDSSTPWGTSAVSVGDKVTFKFEVFKNYLGTHRADVLKAWLSTDGTFTESETIAYDFHEIHKYYTNSWSPGPDSDETYYVTSSLTISQAMAGNDYWLLGRVTCTESLLGGAWDAQWSSVNTPDKYKELFTSTVNLSSGQGNSMITKLSVNPVPEPTTMLLFGTGIVGLAGIARRKRD